MPLFFPPSPMWEKPPRFWKNLYYAKGALWLPGLTAVFFPSSLSSCWTTVCFYRHVEVLGTCQLLSVGDLNKIRPELAEVMHPLGCIGTAACSTDVGVDSGWIQLLLGPLASPTNIPLTVQVPCSLETCSPPSLAEACFLRNWFEFLLRSSTQLHLLLGSVCGLQVLKVRLFSFSVSAGNQCGQ